MLVVGRRLLPWVLWQIARTGSRELFTLSIVAIAIGIAYIASHFFSVSFALGAFFAGMVMRESEFSHRAAEESLPLRDAFSVLFFVSVGMLFDPTILLDSPLRFWPSVAIIVIGKAIAAMAMVRALRRSTDRRSRLGPPVSRRSASSHSFSPALGVGSGSPPEGRDLILAGAIISIILNPVVFLAVADDVRKTDLSGHAILVGYGRVGSIVGQNLKSSGTPFLVIEDFRQAYCRTQRSGDRGHQRQRRFARRAEPREPCRRAKPRHRDSECLRGMRRGGTGTRRQSGRPHRRACPLRRGSGRT